MTIAEAVKTRALAITAVATIVATRAWIYRLPQSPTLPALRIQRIDEDEDMQLRGAGGLHTARLQVDAVALNSRDQAIALDAAVHGDGAGSGLCGWRGTVGTILIKGIFPAGVREGYDAAEVQQFKVMRDYLVQFRYVS